MLKKVLLIANPVAGGTDKTPIIEAARAHAEKLGFRFRVYETTHEDDEKHIRELAFDYDPDRILVAGGDGTVKMCAEALQGQRGILGILPSGSANGLSVDLGLPATLEENLEVAFSDNFRSLDMVVINGKKSLHLSDLGLNASLVKNYQKGDMRGMMGYLLQGLTTLKESSEPFEAQIEADGKKVEVCARMIVIANSQKYGTGVTINPYGKMDDGKFEIVILKNFDLMMAGKILTGNIPVGTDDVPVICTDKAVIVTKEPVSFQIDGEYCGLETRLDISILPGEIKVAVP